MGRNLSIIQNMFAIIFLLAIIQLNSCDVEINEKFAWKTVGFDWPSPDLMRESIQKKDYIPKNNVPVGLSLWKNKIFITIPRWKTGVASTLNYITMQDSKSPLLIPYPSWESNLITQSIRNSNQPKDDSLPIVSVMRSFVDVCDRLWVLDDGVEDIFGKKTKIVHKSILIYDLNTDTLIKRYFFDDASLKPKSFLGNIVVDVTADKCEDAFAYVSDHSGFDLIVYNLKEDSSWLINHLYFHPDPLSGEIFVGGIRAHWTDGVLGLALGDINENGYRTLYFHALTSTTQFEVSTQTIQNKTWSNDRNAFDEYKLTGMRGPKTQSTTNFYDSKTGVIVYTQLNKNGLACWKSTKELNPSTFTLFVENEDTLELPSDVKMGPSRNVWVMSTRLPRFLYGQQNQSMINIRIMHIDLDTAIDGTACAE